MSNIENGLAKALAAVTASDAENNLPSRQFILQLFLPAIRGMSVRTLKLHRYKSRSLPAALLHFSMHFSFVALRRTRSTALQLTPI
jgi:hypothetical protein